MIRDPSRNDGPAQAGGQLAPSLAAIAAAPHPPSPWRDGDRIPWHEAAFSERMLRVHLDPDTHMASRAPGVIRDHVRWLRERLEAEFGGARGLTVLDVGCGPGLYCHELARNGVRALGFDFAPAPLAWARETAEREGLDCVFRPADLTALTEDDLAALGPVDAVTFWYGEFHSFPAESARRFLPRLASLLRPGGLFVLEFQTWDSYPREDLQEWQSCARSVFSDRPHLWLQEYHWDEDQNAEINVHWILDAATGALSRYAQCSRAYTDEELVDLFDAAGLGQAEFRPPITGVSEKHEFDMMITRRESDAR